MNLDKSIFLFLLLVCAGWQTSGYFDRYSFESGLSDEDAGPASVFLLWLCQHEADVVMARVSKENALCFRWSGAAEGIKCLVNPPRRDRMMISVRFPGSKTQKLTVKCCELDSTADGRSCSSRIIQRLSWVLHGALWGISYLILLMFDYTAGGSRARLRNDWASSHRGLWPLLGCPICHTGIAGKVALGKVCFGRNNVRVCCSIAVRAGNLRIVSGCCRIRRRKQGCSVLLCIQGWEGVLLQLCGGGTARLGEVKQEHSTWLRAIAGSEICSSGCSLTSELQKLSVEGDILPYAGASFWLIELVMFLCTHQETGSGSVWIIQQPCSVSWYKSLDEGLSRLFYAFIDFLWTQEALLKVIRELA